ncbi:MAG: 50S ribosomal protein L16 [Candidatus Woesearchaeota archaeon]
MAKLRKWAAYRTIERPYTRFSKVRGKAFVKTRPGKKVIKYNMGDVKGGVEQFDVHLQLICKEFRNVRAHALESARIAALRGLEDELGKKGFLMRIRTVPHHAIRENPLAAGAGADRLSTGMKHSFGKIICMAARVEAGSVMFDLYVPVSKKDSARDALKRAGKKLPMKISVIEVKKNN